MVGTTLQQVGLCVTTVSVFQMLKGSILLFSALLSVWFLKRQMTTYNWIGISLCLVSLGLVGLSSVWAEEAAAARGAALLPPTADVAAAGAGAALDPPANPTEAFGLQLFGIAMIIVGQLVCASQYVIE